MALAKFSIYTQLKMNEHYGNMQSGKQMGGHRESAQAADICGGFQTIPFHDKEAQPAHPRWQKLPKNMESHTTFGESIYTRIIISALFALISNVPYVQHESL